MQERLHRYYAFLMLLPARMLPTATGAMYGSAIAPIIATAIAIMPHSRVAGDKVNPPVSFKLLLGCAPPLSPATENESSAALISASAPFCAAATVAGSLPAEAMAIDALPLSMIVCLSMSERFPLHAS